MLQTVYYDPFKVLARSFRANQAAVEQSEKTENAWTPDVDICENATAYELTFDLPGIDPKTIEVVEQKNVLTVSGERAVRVLDKEVKVRCLERKNGCFKRQFTLPEDADTDAIKADSQYGVLSLSIPRKKAEDSRKTIQVKVSE